MKGKLFMRDRIDELGLRRDEEYLQARKCLPQGFEDEVWEGIRDDYDSDHQEAS